MQINLTSEDWDDSVILQCFYKSIENHRFDKKEQRNQIKQLVEDPPFSEQMNLNPEKLKVEKSPSQVSKVTPNTRNSFISKSRNELKRKIGSIETTNDAILPDRPINHVKFQNPLTTFPAPPQNNINNLNTSSFPQESLDIQSSQLHPPQDNSFFSQQYSSQDKSQNFPFNILVNQSISSEVIEDALQNMLMAWYHSGYATGRYQTLLELSQNQVINSSSSEKDNFNVSTEK